MKLTPGKLFRIIPDMFSASWAPLYKPDPTNKKYVIMVQPSLGDVFLFLGKKNSFDGHKPIVEFIFLGPDGTKLYFSTFEGREYIFFSWFEEAKNINPKR